MAKIVKLFRSTAGRQNVIAIYQEMTSGRGMFLMEDEQRRGILNIQWERIP